MTMTIIINKNTFRTKRHQAVFPKCCEQHIAGPQRFSTQKQAEQYAKDNNFHNLPIVKQ